MADTTRTTIMLENELRERVEEIAKRDRRTLTATLSILIADGLAVEDDRSVAR